MENEKLLDNLFEVRSVMRQLGLKEQNSYKFLNKEIDELIEVVAREQILNKLRKGGD